ncbi:MAG: hypothetical protein GC182_03175 [Rhodopseudomonas sp.]|nr:hypothetical protein [Rhodopseudomonas sp.]
MPEAIKWKSKVLLVKIESAYGTDPTPTGAADAILATNVTLQPMEGEDVSRELERPYLGGQEMIPAGLRSVLTFSTELAGSGTAGEAPGWGVLARACALAETIEDAVSVTYSPISLAMESAAVYFWIGATKHVLLGARGTAEITLDAQGIPRIAWTITGLWTLPAESAAATPDLTSFLEPLIATKANTPAFTVNAVSLVLRSYKLTLGNDVQPRLLVGREEIIIPDRAEQLVCNVEAVPLTTLNPFALAQARTRVAVSIVHGTAAGNIVTIAAPTCQVKRMTGYEQNQNILEWPLPLAPLPDEGNDQFSIVLT